jgi:hypothetical protein
VTWAATPQICHYHHDCHHHHHRRRHNQPAVPTERAAAVTPTHPCFCESAWQQAKMMAETAIKKMTMVMVMMMMMMMARVLLMVVMAHQMMLQAQKWRWTREDEQSQRKLTLNVRSSDRWSGQKFDCWSMNRKTINPPHLICCHHRLFSLMKIEIGELERLQ